MREKLAYSCVTFVIWNLSGTNLFPRLTFAAGRKRLCSNLDIKDLSSEDLQSSFFRCLVLLSSTCIKKGVLLSVPVCYRLCRRPPFTAATGHSPNWPPFLVCVLTIFYLCRNYYCTAAPLEGRGGCTQASKSVHCNQTFELRFDQPSTSPTLPKSDQNQLLSEFWVCISIQF